MNLLIALMGWSACAISLCVSWHCLSICKRNLEVNRNIGNTVLTDCVTKRSFISTRDDVMRELSDLRKEVNTLKSATGIKQLTGR